MTTPQHGAFRAAPGALDQQQPLTGSNLLAWLRRGATLLVGLLVLDYLVLPQIAGTEKALRLLHEVNPWLLGAATTAEAASLVSYSLMTRSLLPQNRSRFSWLFRSDLTGLGVSHLLPGGGATANALRYRLLHEGGASAEDAAVGVAVEAVLSTVVLGAMTWAALVCSIPFFGPSPLYVTCAIVGALLLAAMTFALLGYQRPHAGVPGWAHALIQHLPGRFRPRLERWAGLAADQLRQLLADRRMMAAAAGWGAGSWLCDACSLWVFLAAYGHRVNPLGLLVAYGLANLLATVPISPGGLGVVEGVLIPSLVGFGTPQAVAVLGVISWRLFEFWAPIPLSGIAYASMRLHKLPRSDEPEASGAQGGLRHQVGPGAGVGSEGGTFGPSDIRPQTATIDP